MSEIQNNKKIISLTIYEARGRIMTWGIDMNCESINIIITPHGERYIELATLNQNGEREAREFHKLKNFKLTYEK